jgi:phosphatidate cytidylyltransferase
MLAQRIATALIGVPAILATIYWGGTLAFSIALGAVLAAAALEFFAATDPAPSGRSRILAPRPPALLGVAAVALLVAAAHNGTDWWSGALALAIALIFGLLILQGDTGAGLRDWLWAIGGVIYVGFLGSHLILLRHLEDGRDWILLVILAVWATDTAAYFIGRTYGRTHPTPIISPRKTLEGSLAGLIGGFGSVLLINWIVGPDVDLVDILPVALLLPLVAQIGDLAESLIKRGAGVKDTGALFPGHGGFLDRLDSILFAAPLVYYFVIWVIL